MLMLEDTQTQLGRIARSVNDEVVNLKNAGRNVVECALAVGEGLLAARALLPPKTGEWDRWFSSNVIDLSHTAAHTYMLLASQRAAVEAADPYSLAAAREVAYAARREERSQAVKTARALAADGASVRAIARELDVGWATARKYIDGAAGGTNRQEAIRNAQAKRRAGMKQRRETARLVAIEARGGNVAEAYSLIRKALQELDRAIATETKRDAKYAMQAAMARLHSAEDEIIKAVKLS